jgi:predicted PurR-regulated permease PerM
MTETTAGRLLVRGLLLVVAAAVLLLLATQLVSVFLRLFLATIVAAAMTPPVDAVVSLLGRWAPPRAAAALAAYLVLVLVLVGLGALVVGPVVAESRAFLERLPSYSAAAVTAYHEAAEGAGPLRDLLGGTATGFPVSALAQQAPSVANQALSLVQYVVGAAFGALNGLMVLLLALYLTVDAPRIRDYLIVFLPSDRRALALRLGGEVVRRLGGWARGQVLLCLVIGAMSWVGLTVLGIPYALLLALVAGLMEAVPTVGPVLSAIPALAVALTVSPWHAGAVVVLYVVIQQVENYVVVPRVMSAAVSVHPLVVLVALMVGGELMGPAGVVLAVPLAATLAVVVDEVRRGLVSRADLGAG